MSVDQIGRETLVSLREQCVIVSDACAALAQSLRIHAVEDGLQAVEIICATLFLVDELVDFIVRTDAPTNVLAEAQRIRRGMLSQAGTSLAVAVRDLPGAEALVRRYSVAQGISDVASA